MGVMLAASFQFQENIRRTVRLVVTICVFQTQNASVSDTDERSSVEIHSLSPVLRELGKQFCGICFPITIGIDQDFDIPWPRDHNSTFVIQGHRVNVVSEIVARVLGDFESIGNSHTDITGSEAADKAHQPD